METIKATRDGVKRTFPIDVWKAMPDDKYGWKQSAEVPKEVKEAKAAKEAAAKEAEIKDIADKAMGKGVKEDKDAKAKK